MRTRAEAVSTQAVSPLSTTGGVAASSAQAAAAQARLTPAASAALRARMVIEWTGFIEGLLCFLRNALVDAAPTNRDRHARTGSRSGANQARRWVRDAERRGGAFASWKTAAGAALRMSAEPSR